ncbi:hypothetical protein GN956_G21524 [Arapaima gigas]
MEENRGDGGGRVHHLSDEGFFSRLSVDGAAARGKVSAFRPSVNESRFVLVSSRLHPGVAGRSPPSRASIQTKRQYFSPTSHLSDAASDRDARVPHLGQADTIRADYKQQRTEGGLRAERSGHIAGEAGRQTYRACSRVATQRLQDRPAATTGLMWGRELRGVRSLKFAAFTSGLQGPSPNLHTLHSTPETLWNNRHYAERSVARGIDATLSGLDRAVDGSNMTSFYDLVT